MKLKDALTRLPYILTFLNRSEQDAVMTIYSEMEKYKKQNETMIRLLRRHYGKQTESVIHEGDKR